jgi:nucleoside-diphosphate-sugar epimerase
MDRNDRILVTGGSGFIGGRLVEVLAERGCHIRVATTDFGHCRRISHLPVELVKADLNDHESLARATSDCNIVFHAAYRFGGSPDDEQRINLDGTCALANSFINASGRRFVHISSITAYGEPCDGEITEQSDPCTNGKWYGAIKRQIEIALLDLYRKRGLEVAILQPTIVYGPYGQTFTVRPLEELRSGPIGLPVGGLCNAVYVDDVVTAAILAAQQDAAVGKAFIVSGSSPTTWREFYRAYEKMLKMEAVVELDEEQMGALLLTRQPSLLRRTARRILPVPIKSLLKAPSQLRQRASGSSRSLYVHSGFWAALYAAKSHARIDKARECLGYNPAFDLQKGMAATADWAHSAGLLSTR